MNGRDGSCFGVGHQNRHAVGREDGERGLFRVRYQGVRVGKESRSFVLSGAGDRHVRRMYLFGERKGAGRQSESFAESVARLFCRVPARSSEID